MRQWRITSKTRLAEGLEPKRPGRWDHPDNQPTQAELKEPITVEDIEDATPEDLARAARKVFPPAAGEGC